jgi:tuftelin-interacting protein 11
MPRRKRVLDDGDSDSDAGSDAFDFGLDNNPDLREERELFEDPYKRKRRRKNGKEDAIYGVFGDDSDEDDYKRGTSSRRTNWTKAPAFVSSEKKENLEREDEDTTIGVGSANISASDEEEEDGEDGGSQGEDAAEVQEYSDNSEPSRPPSPRVRLEEDVDYVVEDEAPKPRIGGIGFKPAAPEDEAPTAFGLGSRTGIGARGGIGAKGGIGSGKSLKSTFAFTSSSTLKTVSLSEDNLSSVSPTHTPAPAVQDEEPLPSSSRASPAPVPDGMPPAFGRPQGQSTRFKREASTPTPKPANLSATEIAHFSKISSSFGSRMLAKMGWQTGAGLGPTAEGIVTPIESKLRPQNMGIAFRGFKEKTEQSKREATRRGEVVSDDEEDEKTKRMKRRVKEAEQKRSDVWKKPKKIKTKIEHKTYEQIIAEAGQEIPAAGVGRIIDATGAVVCITFSHRSPAD